MHIHLVHWFLDFIGVHNGEDVFSTRMYNFWSGFGSNISVLALIGTVFGVYRLKREMLEESGLTIGDAKIIMIDDEGTGESQKTLKDTGEVVLCKMKFYVYKIELPTSAANTLVQPGDDIQKLNWLALDTLLEQKLTPPSRDFFVGKMHLV
jgi:8-oxo-dGTP pyrophosphatase MutT (NUDIX family)